MALNTDSILLETLVEQGTVTRETLEPLVKEAEQAPGGLGALLIQRGVVSEDVILDIYASKLKLEKIDLSKSPVEKKAIDRVPLKIAEYYRLLPVKFENRKLTVAVSTPFDIRTQDAVQTVLGCEIVMALVREQDVL